MSLAAWQVRELRRMVQESTFRSDEAFLAHAREHGVDAATLAGVPWQDFKALCVVLWGAGATLPAAWNGQPFPDGFRWV